MTEKEKVEYIKEFLDIERAFNNWFNSQEIDDGNRVTVMAGMMAKVIAGKCPSVVIMVEFLNQLHTTTCTMALQEFMKLKGMDLISIRKNIK